MLDLIMTTQFRKDLKRINKRGKDLSLLKDVLQTLREEQAKNNQIFAMMSSPFSQSEYLSPILFIVLGDNLCRWEKILTPNYILMSPNTAVNCSGVIFFIVPVYFPYDSGLYSCNDRCSDQQDKYDHHRKNFS